MRVRGTAWAAVCAASAFGCVGQPDETREIVDNLVEAGFRAKDIKVVNGVVWVGGDAEVTLAASREMVQPRPGKEQYRDANTISTSLHQICVDTTQLMPAPAVFTGALDFAIQNWEAEPLTFAMPKAPSPGCNFTITVAFIPGLVGASSGYPSGGLPFSTITIGGGLGGLGVDVLEHIITHQLGHAVGFRHSDFFNPAISCGSSSGGESDLPGTAILIPGTPSTATVGGSLMNTCYRTTETGEFTANDESAVVAVYGVLNGLDFNIAFQSRANTLWVVGPGGPGETGIAMKAGTSPSITRLAGGGYQVAFQTSGGALSTTGAAGTMSFSPLMDGRSSPSITALPSGGYQIAFQSNSGSLWTTDGTNTRNMGGAMARGTSPSITAMADGNYRVAFQSSSGLVATLSSNGSGGSGELGLAMAPGTSPSIARLLGGGYVIAFHAQSTGASDTGTLWTTGTQGTSDSHFAIQSGTSPSVAGLAAGSWQAAFLSPSQFLWITGAAGTKDLQLGPMLTTSPSIAARADGSFNLDYNANTGVLWNAGATGIGSLGFQMAPNTNPSVN